MKNDVYSHGYFLYNTTSSTLYRNQTDCWFNVSDGSQTTYQLGDYINIEREGNIYNTSILTIAWDVHDYNNATEEDTFDNTSDCFSFPNTPVVNILNVSNITFGAIPAGAYNYTSTLFCINDSNWTNATYNISYQWDGISWRTDFGVAGLNGSVIEPMVDNPHGDPDWSIEWGYMQNVSIFGTYYDIILANDTGYTYQRCVYEPPEDGQCAKKAWLVPTSDGNFSSSNVIGVNIGQNFTTDLYLAAVGPHDGDGITVANFSTLSGFGLSQYPAIGDVPLADGTMSYFTVLDETTLGRNLDMNDSTNVPFYMLTFDSDFNGVQKLTSNLIDDDLEIVEWCYNDQGSETQIDFSGDENYTGMNASWTRENWNGLPSGIYNGNARFGEHYPGLEWEDQPEWQIPFYNNTHMLISKDRWKTNESDNVSIYLKVYDFDQTAIQGANVSVQQVAMAMPFMGFQILPAANYSVDTTYNVTDQYGYALLEISPVQIGQANPGEWAYSEYQVVIRIDAPQGTKTWERWFCVGVCGW